MIKNWIFLNPTFVKVGKNDANGNMRLNEVYFDIKNIVLQEWKDQYVVFILFAIENMSENANRKYSKISSALKYYFLTNLYYHCLDIREAAQKCNINYSTAKLILRDLSQPEKKCIKRLVRQKEKDEKEGMNFQETSTYIDLESIPPTHQLHKRNLIEIVSSVGFNFFAAFDKK